MWRIALLAGVYETFDWFLLRTSLQILAGQQSGLGAIPNNVSVATWRLDHTNAGSLERALLWLRYQDSNGCGLLEVREAADWADLLANRFNILLDIGFFGS